VVFVLNAAATLERALASVTSPDQPPVELLVLDGGSTDGTLDIIRRFETKIAFWRSFRDGNACLALNEGVARATKDVICLLPADDWIEPGALRDIANTFASDPTLEVVSCGVRIVRVDADGRVVTENQVVQPRELAFTMDNLVDCPLSGGRFILRKLYNTVGGYDNDLWMSNDLDFFIRILMRRPKSAVIPRVAYTYRRHEGSRTLSGTRDAAKNIVRSNTVVAARHLDSSSLTWAERQALRGLHGRGCANLARMCAAEGRFREAAQFVLAALKRDLLWPIKMPWWIVKRALRPNPMAAS
jgi:glycosyltransferase involved in cell wall biosynthesis